MSTQTETPSQHHDFAEARHAASEKLQAYGGRYVVEPARDLASLLRDYAHEKPDVAAMWCFGLGFIIGWKLRG